MNNFTHFHTLDPSARNVSLELLARAEGEPSSMTAFLFHWMAFNGWMAAVTGHERDSEMIDSLAGEPRLIAAYDALIADNPDFQREVDAFASLWPVYSVSAVRAKLGYDAFRRLDRPSLVAECEAQNVKQRPAGWVPGTEPSWEQILRTIYQVRCNFFHGEKSEHVARDRDLIDSSDRVLKLVLIETDCFNWTDQ